MKVYILHGSHWSQCGEVGADWIVGVYEWLHTAQERLEILKARVEAAPKLVYVGEWMHEYDENIRPDDTEFLEELHYWIEEHWVFRH